MSREPRAPSSERIDAKLLKPVAWLVALELMVLWGVGWLPWLLTLALSAVLVVIWAWTEDEPRAQSPELNPNACSNRKDEE